MNDHIAWRGEHRFNGPVRGVIDVAAASVDANCRVGRAAVGAGWVCARSPNGEVGGGGRCPLRVDHHSWAVLVLLECYDVIAGVHCLYIALTMEIQTNN